MATWERSAKKIGVGLAIMALCCSGDSIAQNLTADDFLPPAQAKTPEQGKDLSTVKQPDAVKSEKDPATKQNAVIAATAQDAINTVVAKRSAGCEMVKFPSGFGWVATGVAPYRTMQNLTATRIAKRNAYVRAFVEAKAELAKSLNGLSNDGKNMIRESLKTVNTDAESLVAIQSDSKESIEQAAAMLLRGFVVYEVLDDSKQNTIYVSVVTTPKTRGRFSRPDPDSIQADSLRDGINAVLTEIQKGLVPPVGGRIISVEKTGEVAFVGFGSAVVQAHDNAAVQAKLNLAADKIAHMRAADALCGTIIGDMTACRGKLDEQTQESIKDFEDTSKEGALGKKDEIGYKKLEKTKQAFVSRMQSTDEYASIRKGILPPGVSMRSWKDADNAFSYCVAVYLPSATQQAAKDAQDMLDSQIVQPYGAASAPNKGTEVKTGAGFTDEKNPNVPRPSGDVKPGPSGKVQDDNKL